MPTYRLDGTSLLVTADRFQENGVKMWQLGFFDKMDKAGSGDEYQLRLGAIKKNKKKDIMPCFQGTHSSSPFLCITSEFSERVAGFFILANLSSCL